MSKGKPKDGEAGQETGDETRRAPEKLAIDYAAEIASRDAILAECDGCIVAPYADALDLPWGARMTPGAKSFLVEAGTEVSCQKATNLLAPAALHAGQMTE